METGWTFDVIRRLDLWDVADLEALARDREKGTRRSGALSSELRAAFGGR